MGVLAEVEIVIPIVLWFAAINPSIEDANKNINYVNAWYGIWIGTVLSYVVQGVVWPITYAIKDSEFLNDFYLKAWFYLG